jgi:hypothetical protein
MSEGVGNVGDIRYEIGKDAAIKGEPLHDGASEEYRRGYQSYKGFGSNVMPRKFGAGRDTRTDWECICGCVNRRYLVQCSQCGLRKGAAEMAKESR